MKDNEIWIVLQRLLGDGRAGDARILRFLALAVLLIAGALGGQYGVGSAALQAENPSHGLIINGVEKKVQLLRSYSTVLVAVNVETHRPIVISLSEVTEIVGYDDPKWQWKGLRGWWRSWPG